jgi:flagellar motor switch/type III secretory pathway protein FliN
MRGGRRSASTCLLILAPPAGVNAPPRDPGFAFKSFHIGGLAEAVRTIFKATPFPLTPAVRLHFAAGTADDQLMTSQSTNPPAPAIPSPAADPKAAANPRKSLVDVLPWVPLTVSLEIPIPGLSVKDLLDLHPGSILKTIHPATSDVPVRANGRLIAWARFELAGELLASRITELV